MNKLLAPIHLGLSVLLVLCSTPALARQQPGAERKAQPTAPPPDLGGVKLRYAGVRWSLLYGSYEGVEEFAVNELQRMVQRSLPYVLETLPATQTPDAAHNLILIGTPAANPRIAELGRQGLLNLPLQPQGYTIACLNPPSQSGRRVIVVAGTDPPGVLYGVMDLNKKFATLATHDLHLREALDALPEFTLTQAPVIENRGIWTWGYVIYDYRRFFDNMARLKMNRLTVWNDVPPINCRQFIEYAHSRGIKVVLGFSWGYALAKLDPANPEHLRLVKEEVLAHYDKYYQNLGMDGIYFQTFTEQDNTTLGGRTIASLACVWVNDIARALLLKHPGLRIEWGLHATSIRDHYQDLQALDSRLAIMWEDAGDIPFSYDPEAPPPDLNAPTGPNAPDATLDYARKLATFRPGSEFEMCAKGWIQMRWQTESEPHGSFIIGERAREFIRDRLRERQPRWDYVNAKWAANFPVALRFYREIRETTSAPLTVVGLIDDGMFEEQIQFSAALLGEMLWNPKRDPLELLDAALNPCYRIVQ
jgi:hypothetical protein